MASWSMLLCFRPIVVDAIYAKKQLGKFVAGIRESNLVRPCVDQGLPLGGCRTAKPRRPHPSHRAFKLCTVHCLPYI